MVNFGYPYNDLVICKDSTDYLGKVPSSLSKMRFNLEFSCHKTSLHYKTLDIIPHHYMARGCRTVND